MKKEYRFFKIITFLVLSSNCLSQSSIDIIESTIKISGNSEEVFYYGFSEGDKLIFNFECLDKKSLKEVEIIEMPTSSKYMDYESKKIENKSIEIRNTGIYKFRFYNSALVGRVCKFKIQRIPLNESTQKFNSTVYWKTIYDSTYYEVQEKYLIKRDTVANLFYQSQPQISSANALNGNKNSQVIDFVIPENTISWSFYIGTGREGKAEYDRALNDFVLNASKVVYKFPGYGPMAALALTGVNYFNKVQGQDNVKYWFLSDANSAYLFQTDQTFFQYKKGDVINEASQMKNPLSGKVYIALSNDNTIDPIVLTIRATAIQVFETWGERPIQKLSVKTRKEAYLQN